ncbi:hypothetical protein [uncultured Sulfitobacter sp.]|uniref:hypothetical protein n=1 Tax=uncultured Sulfitobacter sp. TaxID=191468 RepID=UPI0026046D99|nr:hypothetical protein [uncultured Sulfitobacter sp.]
MLRTLPTKTLSAEPQLAITRTFVAEHGTDLCNAAGRIAGEAGTAHVLRLMSMLRKAPRLDRTMRLRLVNLHRLLSLDPAGEAHDPDLSNWVFLDPASEEVEHLCLLTDRLYDLLVDISTLDAKWEKQALDLPAQKAA